MAQFTVNPSRFDPYKNFKFRVKWDGKYVAGVSKVGALKRTTEVVKHREGGDPSSSRKSPGRTEFEAITLERGVTHDTEFEKWANKVWHFRAGLGAETSLKDFRKDIILEMYNEAGQVVIAYRLYRCWVQVLHDRQEASSPNNRDRVNPSSSTTHGGLEPYTNNFGRHEFSVRIHATGATVSPPGHVGRENSAANLARTHCFGVRSEIRSAGCHVDARPPLSGRHEL